MRVIFSFLLMSLALASCQKEVRFECKGGHCLIDTATQPPVDTTWTQIKVENPNFDEGMDWWSPEYPGEGANNNFHIKQDPVTGDNYLNFYASQPDHYEGAPQETPFNGFVTQTINELPAGHYKLQATGGAVGTGMYLYVLPLSEAGEFREPLKEGDKSMNTLEFDIAGGSINIGFACFDAGGDQPLAPYFRIYHVQLWKTK